MNKPITDEAAIFVEQIIDRLQHMPNGTQLVNFSIDRYEGLEVDYVRVSYKFNEKENITVLFNRLIPKDSV